MVYKSDIIICSSSFEINFVSDIAIFLSLDQLKLASALLNEMSVPLSSELTCNRLEITYPYTRFDIFKDDLETELTEFYKDSGIDTSEIRSVLSSKSQVQPTKEVQKSPSPSQSFCEVPLEILFTAGKISCCLYQFCVTPTIQGVRRSKRGAQVAEVSGNGAPFIHFEHKISRNWINILMTLLTLFSYACQKQAYQTFHSKYLTCKVI